MVTALIVVSLLSGPQNQPPVQSRPCPVSDDAGYAFTVEHPVRVGGGATSMVARQRRYLDSLRGPDGQPLTYTRKGSAGSQASGRRPVDVYSVSYAGLEAPITLYLDAYTYEEPLAPKGYTCVAPGLGPPPVDSFVAMDSLRRLAIEQGSTRDFTPISLDQDGSATHGVALDWFRTIALSARTAAAAGTPMSPASPLKDVPPSGLRAFAYPVRCGDRTVLPVSLEMLTPQGVVIRRLGDVLSGEALAGLAPGFTPPAGSIGASFGLGMLRNGDTVRIAYADDLCDSTTRVRSLVARATAAKALSLPPPALPAGAAPDARPVWLQTVVDVDGLFQQASYVGGPETLLEAARAAITAWRAEPARVNGTPVIFDTLLIVQFK